jgi:hypothetical protein
MMDGTYTGVLDRIEDGETAVLLLEADGETVDQREVDLASLPDAGQHEGAVFEVVVDGGEVAGFEFQPQTEAERREAAQDRFDSLSKRLGEE